MKQPLPVPPPPPAPLPVRVKLATQFMLWFRVTEKPQSAPLQPEKNDVLSAAASNAICAPAGNCAWHCVPHWIPAGVERTLPMPLPPSAMVSVRLPPSSLTVLPFTLPT